MRDNKFTHGPWEIYGQDIFGNEENGYICTWSGRKANANLMAASPDLIEALENIVALAGRESWDRATTGRQILLKDAKAAIAKARGE